MASKPATNGQPTPLPGINHIDCYGIPHLSSVLKGLEFVPNVFVRTRTRRAAPTAAPAAAPAAPAGTPGTTTVIKASAEPATASGSTTAATTATTTSAAAKVADAKTADAPESVVLYDVVRNFPGAADFKATSAAPPSASTAAPIGTHKESFAAADGSGTGHARALAFLRAGPRPTIVWKPAEVTAAIVTCGGLCPGLNDVISELVSVLYYNYGVDTIYGVRNGYRGFTEHKGKAAAGKGDPNWVKLTPDGIRDIHLLGGTILGSSRGGFDAGTDAAIVDECVARGVNQIYAIGGDGTHRAATKIAHEALRRGLKLTVACVPKTVDNDVAVIDHSFGFETAVGEAVKAIRSAAVEARCCPNGIGLVTLMGRTAGHIAANATLASREVDLCLVPEVPFALEPVLQYIFGVVKAQGYAVVVVAEGAGVHLMPSTGKTDASGNARLAEIGKYLHAKVDEYFAARGSAAGTKYHDPSYMIRSVPCNAADTILCASLAQGAVHGAMHGYTAFSSGTVNNRTALIPLTIVADHSPALLNPGGRTWERVLSTTQQPSDLTVPLTPAATDAGTAEALKSKP